MKIHLLATTIATTCQISRRRTKELIISSLVERKNGSRSALGKLTRSSDLASIPLKRKSTKKEASSLKKREKCIHKLKISPDLGLISQSSPSLRLKSKGTTRPSSVPECAVSLPPPKRFSQYRFIYVGEHSRARLLSGR